MQGPAHPLGPRVDGEVCDAGTHGMPDQDHVLIGRGRIDRRDHGIDVIGQVDAGTVGGAGGEARKREWHGCVAGGGELRGDGIPAAGVEPEAGDEDDLGHVGLPL